MVIDDAQWADLDSLRALLFVLRRLAADRVLTRVDGAVGGLTRLPEGLRRLADGQTGTTIELGALDARQVRALAASLGLREFPYRTAQRLHAHTRGNPLYVRTLLSEVPADRWRDWQPVLPAPRAFAALVARRLESCGPAARRLVEAAAVLGGTTSLATAAALGKVDDPLSALEEATVVDLLRYRDEPGVRDVAFPHPLVQAAVYGQMDSFRRARLHARAAELLEDEGAALRHRVAAAGTPDAQLAAELEAFGRREANAGAWASAASALVEASRLSPNRAAAGGPPVAGRRRHGRRRRSRPGEHASPGRSWDSRPARMRDAALGYLAVVRGRSSEAENLLHRAWERVDPDTERQCRRHDRPAAGAARGRPAERCGRRRRGLAGPIELAAPGEPVRAEAQAVLGLGLAWQGRLADGLAVHEDALAEIETPGRRVRCRRGSGWRTGGCCWLTATSSGPAPS